MPTYTDLLISGNDFTLDAGGNPVMVHDRDCIAQDLVHMIRESGLLAHLVGNRDERLKASILIELEIAVENDKRIKPGSVLIEEPELGEFYLVADTLEFGKIKFHLEAS